MSRMGVAPLILFCALFLTTLQVNAAPVPTDHVTDQQITALEAATLFNDTDADQDGQVSFEEFSNIPSGGPVNTEYKQLMFAYADVNRDGVLSLDEFTHFAELLATDPSQRGDQELSRIMNANEWFKVYDADHDGQISPEEAIAMVDQQHSNTKSLSKLATLVLFDKADGDQDSRLSFLEFVMFITSVEDTLKRAEAEDAQLPTADATTTEETVTDYMEPVEGVTGSMTGLPSDVIDSQTKTVPAEWAPFIQTTTEITKSEVGDAIDKILLPPHPSIVDETADDFNNTTDVEDIVLDPTTTALPEEEPKAETKPFVAGGDFMKDPPETTIAPEEESKAETKPFVAGGDFMKDPPETIPDSTTVTEPSAATETTPATEPTPATKSDDSSELVVDGKQTDFEKTPIDVKMTSAEQAEVAALMNRMAQESQTDETTTTIAEDSSTSAAPVDLLEQAPSAESSSPLVQPTADPAANKAILQMADQDNDGQITMAEAFDFVRVFIKVNNYLLLESLFVQNDQDGDRKLNPDEYVAFLKALVDSCNLVSDDTCDSMKLATYGDQTPADTSVIPIMIKEQPSDPPTETEVLATSPESVEVTSESPSSSTEIPILIIEEPSEKQKPEESPKAEVLTSDEEAALGELFAQAIKEGAITEEDQSATTATTERSEAEFIPIILVERPQETPREPEPTAEQKAILAGLFLEQSGETKQDKDKSSQSHSAETTDNTETTTKAVQNQDDTLQLLGFGEHTGEWATTSIAPPVMSEESQQNLQALTDVQKSSDVEIMRIDEGDYGYFVHDRSLCLFLAAFFLVLLVVVLAVVVTRRITGRREKIYNVS